MPAIPVDFLLLFSPSHKFPMYSFPLMIGVPSQSPVPSPGLGAGIKPSPLNLNLGHHSNIPHTPQNTPTSAGVGVQMLSQQFPGIDTDLGRRRINGCFLLENILLPSMFLLLYVRPTPIPALPRCPAPHSKSAAAEQHPPAFRPSLNKLQLGLPFPRPVLFLFWSVIPLAASATPLCPSWPSSPLPQSSQASSLLTEASFSYSTYYPPGKLPVRTSSLMFQTFLPFPILKQNSYQQWCSGNRLSLLSSLHPLEWCSA